MTLIIQKPTGAKLVLRKGWQPMDADAAAYISAVETADGQALEEKTKIAIDNFVLGCKADGIWTAIKASCILSGARTLTGALVPLVGTAPTNVGGLFVSGDYNRKTGLVGDGSTKYLDSNRANNADPQDNHHISTFVNTASTVSGFSVMISTEASAATTLGINTTLSESGARSRNQTIFLRPGGHVATGLHACSRSSSGSFLYRVGGSTTTASIASTSPSTDTFFVFRRNSGTASYSNARIAFYSIGESLNLALLDARVTDLINAFAAAIP
jgi:hypothetical protein